MFDKQRGDVTGVVAAELTRGAGLDARIVAFIFPGPDPADVAEKYTPVTFKDIRLLLISKPRRKEYAPPTIFTDGVIYQR